MMGIATSALADQNTQPADLCISGFAFNLDTAPETIEQYNDPSAHKSSETGNKNCK